jgi:hypothetical protein
MPNVSPQGVGCKRRSAPLEPNGAWGDGPHGRTGQQWDSSREARRADHRWLVPAKTAHVQGQVIGENPGSTTGSWVSLLLLYNISLCVNELSVGGEAGSTALFEQLTMGSDHCLMRTTTRRLTVTSSTCSSYSGTPLLFNPLSSRLGGKEQKGMCCALCSLCLAVRAAMGSQMGSCRNMCSAKDQMKLGESATSRRTTRRARHREMKARHCQQGPSR